MVNFPRFHPRLWHLLLLMALILPALLPLFRPGYFYTHDDIQLLRLKEMQDCFTYGQIPCRWVSDFGAGFGHPLFNYHPVLAYYLGMIPRLLGFSFLASAKILFGASLLLSGIFFFYLASLFFSLPLSLLGSLLFVYAPYHAVQIYVRGALTEAWGIAFFPLIFYAIFHFFSKPLPKFFLLSVLSLSGLFLAHNILSLVFLPLVIIWSVYCYLSFDKVNKINKLTLSPRTNALATHGRRALSELYAKKGSPREQVSSVLGLPLLNLILIFVFSFGLSAFFLLPALLEKSLVRIDFLISDYYDFRNHFVTVFQLLFSRVWGWGPSRIDHGDELSFALGWPYWWLAALAILVYALDQIRKIFVRIWSSRTNALATHGRRALSELYAKKGSPREQASLVRNFPLLFFALIFFGATFFTHAKSVWFWNHLPLISFVQFPWRLLVLCIFSSSFLALFFISSLPKLLRYPAIILSFSALLYFNLGYFTTKDQDASLSDANLLSGPRLVTQQKATLGDYVPAAVHTLPTAIAPSSPSLNNPLATASAISLYSNRFQFKLTNPTNASVTATIPIFYFPTWKITNPAQTLPYSVDPSLGTLILPLPPGQYTVDGLLQDTPLRRFSNYLTLFSLFALIVYLKKFPNYV